MSNAKRFCCLCLKVIDSDTCKICYIHDPVTDHSSETCLCSVCADRMISRDSVLKVCDDNTAEPTSIKFVELLCEVCKARGRSVQGIWRRDVSCGCGVVRTNDTIVMCNTCYDSWKDIVEAEYPVVKPRAATNLHVLFFSPESTVKEK